MERLNKGEDTVTSIKDSIHDKVYGKGGKDGRGVASKGGEFAEVLAVAMEKAKETILVTPSGIVILSKLLHP